MSNSLKSSQSNSTNQQKKDWIREASLKRLNMLMLNKSGSLNDGFTKNAINVNELEKSGLNDFEKSMVDRWIRGHLSGRHCLLALLEHRLNEHEFDKSNIKSFTTGSLQRPIEFEMLSSTLSLPADFLCDSGYLYENIFSKPPCSVIKEALHMLATKAMEKNIASLRVDQINLALKQLRVDILHSSVMSTESGIGTNGGIAATAAGNASSNSGSTPAPAAGAAATASALGMYRSIAANTIASVTSALAFWRASANTAVISARLLISAYARWHGTNRLKPKKTTAATRLASWL